MGYITTTFLGKTYTIPEDVRVYIDLLDFTDNVKTQLVNTFVRKLKDEIRKDNIGLIGDEDLAPEVERQVSRFIAKLCDNGIFSRTINDYWKNNKGYQLYSDVNKAALEKMKSILLRKLDDMQAGYEYAINKAESHVTGMGFSILSGSFINHAVYAAMEASTINKQTKEAEAQYQRDMSDLRSRLSSQYGGEQSQYINGTYIPNMEAALTVFAYELLDKYVADLVANGKFDGKTLDYVDISRSNDLLKNLALSANKKAIIESAFVACPYNTAVYMQAMKHNLLDYDSFQTAKVFKQGDTILSFLKENCGEVSFPTRFNINYYCVGLLASLTGKTPEDYLRVHTEQYATGIVKAYTRVAEMISDKDHCRKVIGECEENSILEGNNICRHKARSYVNPIVTDSIWSQLTEQCGHKDLLKRIQKYIPQDITIGSKEDADAYFIEQLCAAFEVARKELADEILRERQAAEERRKEELRRKQEAERIREEKRQQQVETNRKAFKVMMKVAAGLLAVVIIYFAVLFINDTVINPAKQYKAAVALMESGDYQAAQEIFLSLDGYKDSDAMTAQCNDAELENVYQNAVQLMNEQKYADAIALFDTLPNFRDSNDLCLECSYAEAAHMMESKKYDEAITILEAIIDYKDSSALLETCREESNNSIYKDAIMLIGNGEYGSAYEKLISLGDYKDSTSILQDFKLVYSKSKVTTEKKTNYYTYSYDVDGYVIREDYNNGEMITDYTYDSQHNLIVSLTTFDNGKQLGTTYTYDSGGNVVQSNYVNYYGEQTTTNFYYEDGLLMSTFAIDDDGSYEETEYTYDSENRLIREFEKSVNEYHPAQYPYESSIDYSYDVHGRLKTKTWTIDGDEDPPYVYFYDDDGYLIRIENAHHGNSEIDEYIYDSNHVLIEEIEYYDGEKKTHTVYSDFLIFYTGEKPNNASNDDQEYEHDEIMDAGYALDIVPAEYSKKCAEVIYLDDVHSIGTYVKIFAQVMEVNYSYEYLMVTEQGERFYVSYFGDAELDEDPIGKWFTVYGTTAGNGGILDVNAKYITN